MPTYTYDATRGNDIDKARELLGLVNVASADTALRDDETIEAVLSREGFDRGVAWLAAGLYAEYAQQPVSVTLPSGLSVNFGALLKAWDRLSAALSADVAGDGSGAPEGGSSSVVVRW